MKHIIQCSFLLGLICLPAYLFGQLYVQPADLLLNNGNKTSAFVKIFDATRFSIDTKGSGPDISRIVRINLKNGASYAVHEWEGQRMLFEIAVDGPVSLLLLASKRRSDYLFIEKEGQLYSIPKSRYKLAIQEMLTDCPSVTNAFQLQELQYRWQDFQELLQAYNACGASGNSKIKPLSFPKGRIAFIAGIAYTDINRDANVNPFSSSLYFNSETLEPDMGFFLGIRAETPFNKRFYLQPELIYRQERVQINDKPLVNGNLLDAKIAFDKFQGNIFFKGILQESPAWKTYLFIGPQLIVFRERSFKQEVEVVPPNSANQTTLSLPEFRNAEIGIGGGIGIRKLLSSGKEIGLEARYNHHRTFFLFLSKDAISHNLVDVNLVFAL
ncbi:MAG: outer membrane beta-barrel protein [Bacteroidota bacterium]